MTDNDLRPLAAIISKHVDWSHPGLTVVADLPKEGQDLATVVSLIHHLRQRKTPDLGYSPDYVNTLRHHLAPADKTKAQDKIRASLDGPLTKGHGNTIWALGPTTLFAGLDTKMCDAVADMILHNRQAWDQGAWGVTRSIVNLLRCLFPLAECRDEALVPLFAWLLHQLSAEWQWARTWSEKMLGNSGHNWWLHTFLGMFQAGLYFPELKELSKFRSFAPDYFEHEILNLMADDGFTLERSGYHWGTVRHIYDYVQIAEANSIPVSEPLRERVRAVTATLWKTITPNGDVPRVGDTGTGHTPGTALGSLRDAAALFAVPEAKFVAEALDSDWSLPLHGFMPGPGRNLLPDYRRLMPCPPSGATADTDLLSSGYYIMRQNWTPAADWVCVEGGPLGSIVNSHDHTHFFNFELYSRGRAILIDNCSGPYGDSPERLWRVSSASHNVATIDGRDHIPTQNEWRWDGAAVPFVDSWKKNHQFAYFSGAHEGYRYLSERVASARRKLFYLRGEYWILLDRFVPETDAQHLYTQHFHIAPDCKLTGDGRLETSGSGGNLLIVPVNGLDGTPDLAACPYPIQGYDNPDYLTYSRNGTGNQLLAVLLIPFEGKDKPDVKVNLLDVNCDGRTVAPWEITGLEIVVNGQRDVYVDQHMQWNLPWQAAGASGDTRLYHSRCDGTST